MLEIIFRKSCVRHSDSGSKELHYSCPCQAQTNTSLCRGVRSQLYTLGFIPSNSSRSSVARANDATMQSSRSISTRVPPLTYTGDPGCNFQPAEIRAGWIRPQHGAETSLMWWHSITMTIQSVTGLSEAPSQTRFGSVTHSTRAFAAPSLARSSSHTEQWGLSSWRSPRARPGAAWDCSPPRQRRGRPAELHTRPGGVCGRSGYSS